MNTQDLIAALSRSEPAAKRSRPWAGAALLALAASLLALMLFLGPRPDLVGALAPTLAKAAFSAAFAAAGLALVMRLARPGRPAEARGWFVVALILASLVAAAIALLGADPQQRLQALTGGAMPWCLVLIPLLALPAALILGAVVKRFAPTQLTLTGAAIGAASGGIGAMAYALRCPVDSIAFVATWYALAIALSAIIGALLGARLLRW